MKKTDFRVMNNKDVEVEFDGKAIAFIKSRKADHKIHAMAEEMIKMALAIGIELTDVIVDGGADEDIDRRSITDFCQTLDKTGQWWYLWTTSFPSQQIQMTYSSLSTHC